MKKILTPLLILFTVCVFSQTEKYPVYIGCENIDNDSLKICFKSNVTSAIIDAIKIPKVLEEDNYTGTANVVFYVTKDGEFDVLYVNTPYKELEAEFGRVFKELPKITPAKFNNHNVEMQFVLPIKFPLSENNKKEPLVEERLTNTYYAKDKNEDLGLIKPDSLELLEHHSELNIPYTHQQYAVLDYYYNRAGNSHTASKPYVYSEVMEYVDLDAQKASLMKDKSGWWGRKLWNEHMVQIQGKGFWFTIDPIVDLQIGKDNSDVDYTYNNTRGIQIQGAIGKKLSFYTSFFESQGRFAEYVNQYAESIKPSGGNPAIIPGRGIAKEFGDGAYDYPVAEAYLSYSPNKTFNFQFGHGKNFIGDGYRSLFISDAASPYPYFKINTTFWKIKYTNTWTWLKDVRPQETVDGVFRTKFMATHYLSWNVTKKLNIGLFESVIWEDSNDRGFDVNYLNPIIFYRAIEFSTGSRGGNAIIGLSGKYKLNDRFSMYTQFVIDEFSTSDMFSGNKSWKNKYGVQLGVKYHHAFGVDNLHLQAEFNSVRPYTYSHNEIVLNYGHNNQSMAHLWGSNFREFILIGHYTKDRWYANAKFNVGKKGFDIEGDPASYGGDLYRNYEDRPFDDGVEIGQGNSTNIFIGDLQVGYLVNPAVNLKIFGGFTYRNFSPQITSTTFDKSDTAWFSLGLRTDVFDWKFDF